MSFEIMMYIVWSLLCFGAGFLVKLIIGKESKDITVEEARNVLIKNGWKEVKTRSKDITVEEARNVLIKNGWKEVKAQSEEEVP